MFIKYYDGENNHYNESDFYWMILDTENRKIIKHQYASTRHAGFTPFEHELVDKVGDPETFQLAKEVAEEMAQSVAGHILPIVGDTVKNTNPRARKHKGSEFIVSQISYWKGAYGRIETTYLHGVDQNGDEVKTNINNCTTLELGHGHLQSLAYRIKVGMNYTDEFANYKASLLLR